MKTIRRLLRVVLVLVVVVVALGAIALALTWQPDRPVAELAQRWAQPPSTFVDVDGMRVHLRDEGPRTDAEPIVLLHGTSSSLHTWDGWTTALAPERRVIRFDLPGFGLTGPHPRDDYSVAAYAKFVKATLDALAVRRAVLVGNSLGGGIAIAVALSHPELVAKLVLVDSGGYPPRATSVPIGFRIAQTPGLNKLARLSLPRSIIESSLRNVYGDPRKVTPELVDRYFELTLREGNRAAVTKRLESKHFGDLASEIPKLRVPTLILWGGRDRLIDPENAERFHREVPQSTRIVFDELGHVPHEEAPAETVVPVRKFLSLP